MRRSLQYGLCLGLLALAVLAGLAGFIVDTRVAVVGAVDATGARVETTGGRFEAWLLGTASLVCVTGAAIVVACGAEVGSVTGDIDRLRSPAWADAEARTMAATRIILRM